MKKNYVLIINKFSEDEERNDFFSSFYCGEKYAISK